MTKWKMVSGEKLELRRCVCPSSGNPGSVDVFPGPSVLTLTEFICVV